MNPDFLIVGAMKAGTTTLYRDLTLHPDIYMSEEKEPEVLIRQGDKAAQAGDYLNLFKAAPAGKMLGEASTGYTKRPDHEYIAQRAFDLCGPTLKVIYLTRDPVARTISQYKHAFSHGETDLSLIEAVRREPRFIHYSRYDWQIAPWLALFGANVATYRFENYIDNRETVTKDVIAFLGLDPASLADLQLDQAFNAADGRRAPPKGIVRNMLHSRFYQRTLKPLVPKGLRDRLKRQVLPKTRAANVDVTLELRAEIAARIAALDA